MGDPVGGPGHLAVGVEQLGDPPAAGQFLAQLVKVRYGVVMAGAGAHPGLAGQFVIAGFDGAADVA